MSVRFQESPTMGINMPSAVVTLTWSDSVWGRIGGIFH